MKQQALTAAVGLLLSAGIGCSGNSNSNPSAATGGAGNGGDSSIGGSTSGGSGDNGGATNVISTEVVSCPSFTTDSKNNLKVAASAANNYSFSSTISIPSQKVASGKDLAFDWSAVKTDMYKEPIDPNSGIGNAVVVMWHLTKEELETKLNNDELKTQDRVIAATYLTQGTSTGCSTTDLTEAGQPIEHDLMLSYLDAITYGPPNYTFMAIIASGTEYGKNSHMMTTFVLDTAETNTEVLLTPESTNLQYEAKLDSLTPTVIPISDANVDLDWSAMSKNAMGRTVDWFSITKILVASFTQTPAELQKNENFLKLDTLATGMWVNEDLTNTHAALSSLKDKDGAAFTGIDNTHTWIVALECGSCMNPAPWYISVLKPCSN